MKKTTLALILAALVALVSWGAMAQEEPMPAEAYVPDGSFYLYAKWDDGLPEYRYLHQETDMLYEVTLDPETDALLKLKGEHLFYEGGEEVTLSEQEVLTILYEMFPDAQQVQLQLDVDDGLYVYEIKFATPLFAAEVELHPETGMLVDVKLDFTRPLKEEADMRENQEHQKNAESKSGEEKKQERKPEDKQKQDSKSENKQQENKDVNASDERISKDRARQIALDKAGGGKVYELELDYDDGRWIYEGELINGDYEYEFEIDAESGKIIEWDKERRDWDD